MNKINLIVETCLETGYLTVDAEERLRKLLQTTKYSMEDFQAFLKLQEAVIAGLVRQESRELILHNSAIRNLLIP